METLRKQHGHEVNRHQNILRNIKNKTIKYTLARFHFLPDLSKSTHINMRLTLGNTNPKSYFPHVENLAFHDLTTGGILPPMANTLLGLGLKFIPTPKLNTSPDEQITTLERFERDLSLKVFFAGDTDDTPPTNSLRVKSNWRPPPPPQVIITRLRQFTHAINATFVNRPPSYNLTKTQRSILNAIKRNPEITIAPADKNLGPVAINTTQYTEWGMTHLLDGLTYTIISEEQALSDARNLSKEIFDWTLRHRKALTDDVVRYIRHHLECSSDDPFGYFYLTIKLHKSPVTTRPVCSDCASVPHALGKWLDSQLQPIVKTQATYFKDSYALKRELDTIHLPPNARIFTYDAVSMYTNIDTEDCINRLTTYLLDPTTTAAYPHLTPIATTEALSLVMLNNRMQFDKTIVIQKKGIAMGMSPAPTIANLYVSLFEAKHISPGNPRQLFFLRRFIDDGIGIWLTDPDSSKDEQEWSKFTTLINTMGLSWEFTDRSTTAIFMDLTITIANGRFLTAIYSKPLSLHLYIPPHSCHAPGIAKALIHGHTLRVLRLCSKQSDIDKELRQFYHRLTARGYSPTTILPLLAIAETSAREKVAYEKTIGWNDEKVTTNTDALFIHLPYHPSNPPSPHIQSLWRDIIAAPPNADNLTNLLNHSGNRIQISKMIVAYSRPPNLGNLLSCRKVKHSRTPL